MKKILGLFILMISILFCFTSCYSEAELEEAKSKSYQEGYNIGYDEGEAEGFEKGKEEYKNDYKKGYEKGYQEAYEIYLNNPDIINDNSKQVYITPYGKRYHYSSTCGGSNSYKVSINNVGGRTPCQKCVGG